MPKWRSPLFSDIRGALQDNVVFSMWKGRPYFRTHVYPSQPRTKKCMANRDFFAAVVAHYQAVVVDDDEKAAWNALALGQLISGFNYFQQIGMKSELACPATALRIEGHVDIEITYELGFSASKAKAYKLNMGTSVLTDITPEEGLTPGEDQSFEYDETVAGTFQYWIANEDALAEGDEPPQDYQAVSNWKRNEAEGTADSATCIVT